jgi:hypothetical protein
MMRRSSLLPGLAMAAMGCAAGVCCAAQQLPVPVTVHLTAPKGALSNASVGIAAGPNQPFSFYKSNGTGDVTVSLAPGAHDLRVFVRGYPVTSEHVDVTAAATITVALGHGATAGPARAVAPATAKTATRKTANTGAAASAVGGTSAKGKASAPAGTSAGANPLKAYASCYFPDGLQITSVDALDAGDLSRFVDSTAGPEKIDSEAAERVMFAYPLTDFFANVRVEELPADRYENLKDELLANLTYLESQPGGPQDAQALPGALHGFEVHGNNRQQLEGDVLGMYVLFDDPAHVAATIHFLNQASWRRKFHTMDEYARLRDQFLTAYTGCVRENQTIGKER